jgi:hypothetical protein
MLKIIIGCAVGMILVWTILAIVGTVMVCTRTGVNLITKFNEWYLNKLMKVAKLEEDETVEEVE